MKTGKRLFLIMCITLPTTTLISQNVVSNSDFLLAKLRLNESMSGHKYETYDAIEGNPFLYKDFHSGELILKSGETYILEMRYDMYADVIHIKLNDRVFAVGYPEKLLRVVIDTVTFTYDIIMRPDGKGISGKGSYFIVSKDGRCQLLVNKNLRIEDPEPPKLLQDAKPARFIPQADNYYLRLEDGHALLINDRNDVLLLLSDKKEAVENFMETRDLGIRKIEDLAAIVDYYNGL